MARTFRQLARRPWLDGRGLPLTALLVLVAVIGIITTVSAPAFVSYWRSATLKGGAQELATILNRGRSLAIAQNTTLCVSQSASKVRFLTGGCAGTVWTGPGTDGNGWFTLQNSITVSSATANVVFNYLGAANVAATYTVQNPVNNTTLSVNLALARTGTLRPCG